MLPGGHVVQREQPNRRLDPVEGDLYAAFVVQ